MGKTSIAWTHYSFNIVWGCDEDSTECAHCYARDLSRQWGWKDGGKHQEIWGATAPRRVFGQKHWDALDVWAAEARAAGERRRVFVQSMGDWAEDHPTTEAELQKIWPYVHRHRDALDYLFLTKRAHNIRKRLPADWWLWTNGFPNVWLGTSVGTASRTALSKLTGRPVIERADELTKIPAVVHFISNEPAVGATAAGLEYYMVPGGAPGCCFDIDGDWWHAPGSCSLCRASIDWVIYGGESGKDFRPDRPEWPRDLRDACRRHSVAFFYKQSADRYPGRGVELDGQIVQELPRPYSSKLLKAA